VIAAVLALSLAAAPAAPFSSSEWRPSARGPRVVLAPRAGTEAALLVRFDTGSADDGTAPGLTRLVQNAMTLGARGLGYAQVLDALYAAGAEVQVTTGVRDASFLLVAHRDDFPALSRMLLEQVFAPQVDRRRLEEARDRTYLDEREASGRGLVEMIADKVIDAEGYGNPPHGTHEGIESIVLQDVRSQLEGPFSPANATVVAAGAFDPAALRKALARVSGPAPRRRARPEVSAPFSLQLPAEREVYLVAYKVAFDEEGRAAAARVAAALIEERLSRFLRSRGLGYSQIVEPVRSGWLDLLLVGLPAHDPSAVALGGYVEDRISDVRDGRYEDAELERARAAVLAGLERTDRDPAALVEALAGPPGPGGFGPALAARVRETSPAALREAIRGLFRPEEVIRILYNPRADQRGPIPESFSRGSAAR
jgi:predicted Zn-dependent peptidase